MPNAKFSEFSTAAAATDIDYVVGYKGVDNVKVPLNLLPSVFMLHGSFQNMFGGDPGGNGMDILEWGGISVPAANHSSALPIPINCNVIAAGFKWTSNQALPVFGVGDLWTVKIYRMINKNQSTTVDANFVYIGDLGIQISAADNGTLPYKFSSGLNFQLNAGDIIRIAGVETGIIATSTNDTEFTLVLRTRP